MTGFVLGNLSTIVTSITYLYIALQAIAGRMSLGSLTAYTQAAVQVQNSIQSVLSGFSGMYEHNLYLNNLVELMARQPSMPVAAEPRPVPQPLRGEIRFEHVSFAYPGAEKNALTDLSFTVTAGETLAVVGRNGAGKTTLFKLICRLYDPLEGRILIDGIDIRDFEPDELRRQIGAMFQDYVDYQATASENIGLGNVPEIANRDSVVSASKQAGSDELIAGLPEGYDTALGKWFDAGVNLSGGEWQKVALARAFMREDARILLLDEPTSALDAQAEYDLFERLRSLTHGRTAVYISHRFSTGTRSEVVYRLLPALAAGATVGASTAALARRFGILAGICAGLFIATDPLFVDNGRDIRGYSLAALGSVIATLILSSRWTRGRLIAYALIMGLAISAQLFAGVVLLCHVAWMLTRRSRPELIRLAPAWFVSLLIGVAANANIQFVEFTQHGLPASMFYPTFPSDLVFFLLGAPVLLPIGLWLSSAGLGLWLQRRKPWLWATIAVLAAVVLVLWLVLRPAFLYPRFFIFLVPACGYLMAAAIARWWVLAPVVVLGAAAAVVSQASGYTEDPLALPQAAAAVARIHESGQRACVIHSDEQVLSAYTTDFTVVTRPELLHDCDAVVVVSWGVDLGLRDEAAREFPRLTTLQAYYPAVVLER